MCSGYRSQPPGNLCGQYQPTSRRRLVSLRAHSLPQSVWKNMFQRRRRKLKGRRRPAIQESCQSQNTRKSEPQGALGVGLAARHNQGYAHLVLGSVTASCVTVLDIASGSGHRWLAAIPRRSAFKHWLCVLRLSHWRSKVPWLCPLQRTRVSCRQSVKSHAQGSDEPGGLCSAKPWCHCWWDMHETVPPA